VVDDNSRDRTAEMSRRAGARVIKHILGLGTGAALSTGFRAALGTDAQIFLTIDGDGQHDPSEMPNLLAPIRNREADVVVGSRLLRECESMPLHKRVGNEVLSIATSIFSGTKITDSQSGYRAYRREVLERAMHEARDYSWASEMLVLASRRNFRIKEVPITVIYLRRRQRGADIKDGLKILYSMIKRTGEDS
jgi:glycosyltransferase involved in cell wall biosynthesis